MREVTPQVTKLYNALVKRGIECEIELNDGYKHIDISIPSAKIDIEVNGLHHYLSGEQIMSDFKRSYWSLKRDDYDTFHVPNFIVDQYFDQLVDALVYAINCHTEFIKDEEKHPWIHRLKQLFR